MTDSQETLPNSSVKPGFFTKTEVADGMGGWDHKKVIHTCLGETVAVRTAAQVFTLASVKPWR